MVNINEYFNYEILDRKTKVLFEDVNKIPLVQSNDGYTLNYDYIYEMVDNYGFENVDNSIKEANRIDNIIYSFKEELLIEEPELLDNVSDYRIIPTSEDSFDSFLCDYVINEAIESNDTDCLDLLLLIEGTKSDEYREIAKKNKENADYWSNYYSKKADALDEIERKKAQDRAENAEYWRKYYEIKAKARAKKNKDNAEDKPKEPETNKPENKPLPSPTETDSNNDNMDKQENKISSGRKLLKSLSKNKYKIAGGVAAAGGLALLGKRISVVRKRLQYLQQRQNSAPPAKKGIIGRTIDKLKYILNKLLYKLRLKKRNSLEYNRRSVQY